MASKEETGRGQRQQVNPLQGQKDVQRLADRLWERPIPPLVLGSHDGRPVNLLDLGRGSSVIYLYPGSRWSPEDEDHTPTVDAVQHRAFRDLRLEITSRHFAVVGVSSEPPNTQYISARENRLTHPLLTDMQCRLANDLGLPIFELDETHWYQRVTLVVKGGRIRATFFPVVAARSAAQALTWIKVQSG